MLYLDFISFSLMSFSRSSIPFRRLRDTSLSRLCRLLLAVTLSQSVLVFWCPWEFWGVLGWYFVEGPSSWDLADALLMVRRELQGFFWKNATEVRGHFYHIVSASLITVDVDLDHMAEILRAKFSIGRLVFFPCFFGRKSLRVAHTWEGKTPFVIRGQYYQQ